jgi:hypothetical protein
METTVKTIEHQLLEFIAAECNAVNVDRLYDDMIDDCYSFKSVGGPFEYMQASRVLSEMDPTAYRCGKNDWLDGARYIGIGDDFFEEKDVENAKEEFANELEVRESELETEIEEMESDEDHNLQELAKLKRDLAELSADLAKVNNYAF